MRELLEEAYQVFNRRTLMCETGTFEAQYATWQKIGDYLWPDKAEAAEGSPAPFVDEMGSFLCWCGDEFAPPLDITWLFVQARHPDDPMYGLPNDFVTMPPRIELTGVVIKREGVEIHHCGVGDPM